MVNRSLRLRSRLLTQAETHSIGLCDVSGIARVVLVVRCCETALAAVLTARLHFGHGLAWPDVLWNGTFHAVSAFNNAGFSLHGDSLMRYAGDAWVLGPVMLGIVIGGIGFPVLQDLRVRLRDPRHWSLHTKLTLAGSAALLVVGAAGMLLFESSNPKTLAPMASGDRLLSAVFASVSARTAGLNAVDTGALTRESLALHFLLTFIGGGSAGTAGGVKVTTAAILLLLVIAEVRGRPDSEAFGRRVGVPAQRQAITVLVLSSVMVVLGTLVLLRVTAFPTDCVIFEVISAFGTVGLSTGITAELPPGGQLTLVVLMYVGRVGTITLATSLALGERRMPWRYTEEHPVVGSVVHRAVRLRRRRQRRRRQAGAWTRPGLDKTAPTPGDREAAVDGACASRRGPRARNLRPVHEPPHEPGHEGRLENPPRRRVLVLLAAGAARPSLAAADDQALLRELRAGGVLLMWPTQTTPGVGDPPGWRLGQCATQRNLDERGIAHAERIGRWFAAGRLVVGAVRHSPWCRARDTAQRAFGRGEEWAALANIFEDRSSGADRPAAAVHAFVRTMKPGELAVLVSHGVTIAHVVGGGMGLATGESVLVRACGRIACRAAAPARPARRSVTAHQRRPAHPSRTPPPMHHAQLPRLRCPLARRRHGAGRDA